MSNHEFETAIDSLDLKLFQAIPSQSSDEDKQSLLAVQLAVRELCPDYNYLEVGSYIGGSIQSHLLDDSCARIISIDKRPDSQPDERGVDFLYNNNSTKRMLDNLSALGPLDKITTIDRGTDDIDPSEIAVPVDLCFVDGEHTDRAVFADFKFCLKVLNTTGAIVFDDAQIAYNGIAECVDHLEEQGVAFKAYALPNKIFVIEMGEFPLHKHARIYERLLSNHRSYLYSLQNNDHYRRFATRQPFRFLRSMVLRVTKGNVSY
jgi:hypothetical protein